MRTILMLTAAALTASFAAGAFAHGDEPHPTCKKGYILTDDHKCVKA